jgi:hypothetical protein
VSAEVAGEESTLVMRAFRPDCIARICALKEKRSVSIKAQYHV